MGWLSQIGSWLFPQQAPRVHATSRRTSAKKRYRYEPRPDAATCKAILVALKTHDRAMTAKEIVRVTGGTTAGQFLGAMVKAGVIEICGRVPVKHGRAPYLYALPEWTRRRCEHWA